MRSTLTIFVAILCLTAFSTSATLQAQDSGRSGERQTELFKKLGLSEDQKAKFTDIQNKYSSDISELRSQGRSSGNREQMQVLVAQKDAEIKQILTDEQFEIYTASNKRGGRSKSSGRIRS